MSFILLVDDDGDMIKLTANWLKKAGYEVATAASGEEAIEFVSSTKPDLIVLDYAMPGMDGPATFKALGEKEESKEIPVLFRTGMDDMSAAEVMESLSPKGVVPKSEGKAALIKAVAAALS